MSKNGYILIHRKIFENSLYFAEIFSKIQAWIDLLLIANHSSRKVDIRGNLVIVNRGQVARSENSLAERWRWSRGKVRRFLKILVAEGMIVQQKTPSITLISIVNYDAYQSNKTTDRTAINTADGTETNNDKLNKTIIRSTSLPNSETEEGEKSTSMNYLSILNCWKEARNNAGLAAGLIGENSKKGALKLASAIDKSEITLADVRRAIHSLLNDTEKRKTYSLLGLANNIEIWLNCSSPQKKTVQLNQTTNVVYCFGVCENCGYSMVGFKEELVVCQKCKNKVKLRKENYEN